MSEFRKHSIPPVNYGANVMQYDANAAVTDMKPKTVVGQYVTDITQNLTATNIEEIIKSPTLETLYLVGNLHTHYMKSPAFDYEHEVILIDGLVTRHADLNSGRVFKWQK